MSNRRDFLRAAAAVPVVAVAPRLAAAAGRKAPTRAHSRAALAVLVDERFAESRHVGRDLALAGARVHAITRGDVTAVWLGQLRATWQREPLPLGGLTTGPVLFCLEQLAADHGLRVVFHGEHVVQPAAHTAHALLRGAGAASLSGDDLDRCGADWPARIAAALAHYRAPAARLPLGPSAAALEPSLPAEASLLMSWIIA